MYTSRKHSLAPESVTSASSAGGGYSPKRRRIVQNTPVPEKYLYRHSTSRLSASRASSVPGESDAPDSSPLGAQEWAMASTLSDRARIITGGDKGQGVDGVGAVEVKRSTLIPESPFARIISRQKQSRGISTMTTSLAYRPPNGSLRTSYGARCENTMAPPFPLCTASVRHMGRDSNMSPPERPTPSGSQHIHSSFQMSTFEFSTPFKPKPSVNPNTREENKSKSDPLLSFFGNALSRAKSALNENRELQDAERKRKLKEDARRRAIEEERRKRDKVFAEIAREEEELARLATQKDKVMETQFQSIASVSNRQPLTSTTVSRASSSTTTVVHESNLHTEQRSEGHIALAQPPRSSDVLTVTDQALVDGIQNGNHPPNHSNRRNIVLNAPAQELPRVATPKQASPRPTAPVARLAKPQVEVICLDSDSDDDEEEQDQQRKLQSAQPNGRGTTLHNVENEEEEGRYGEGVSDDDRYEDEDEEGYDEQEYEEEEGGYEDDVEEEEELDEEEVEVIDLDGEEGEREEGEGIGVEVGEEEEVEEEEVEEEDIDEEVEGEEVVEEVVVEEEVEVEVEEVEEEGEEEGEEGGGEEEGEKGYEEHQVNSDGGANLVKAVDEEVQEVPDLRQRFGASQAPVFPPGEEEVPTEKDEESFRDDHDEEEEEGEQEADVGEGPEPTVPQVILNHGSEVSSFVGATILTSQPAPLHEAFQDHGNDKLVNLEESENTQLYQGESLAAVPVYPGQDRERTPAPELKPSYGPDEDGSATEVDRFSEFHSQSDVREMHENEDEELSPDDLIQDRTTKFEDEVARGGNEEYVEEGEQEGLDFTKGRTDEGAALQDESETTVEAVPVMETGFFHFHNAGRPQNFEKHDEEKKALADVPSIAEGEGDAIVVDPQLEHQAIEINTSSPKDDAENLEVEEEGQLEGVEVETKVPPTAKPYFVQIIEDSGDEGIAPQPADSLFEALSKATTYEGGEGEEEEEEGKEEEQEKGEEEEKEEEEEVIMKWEMGKEQEGHEDEQKGRFSSVSVPRPVSHHLPRTPSPVKRDGFAVVIDNYQGMEGHSSPPNSGDGRESRGEAHEAASIHIAPLYSTECQVQEEFPTEGRTPEEFVPERIVLGEETPTTSSRAKRQNLPAALDVKQIEAKHKKSPVLGQPSPIKLGEEIHSEDEAIMSDTRSVASRASRASSIVSTLGSQPQKRKRGPNKRKAKSSRDQTYTPMKDTEGRYIGEEEEVEDVSVSPRKKKQRRATCQRKATESSLAKMDPFRDDEAVEVEQRKEVMLTSEAMAAHALGHNHDAEGIELRDGKVIPHATPVASRRPSPAAERLHIVEGQIEGSAVATGVATGKGLRDGKVLAPLTVPSTPSKRKTPPPTMTTTPKSATSPRLVRDRPLLFGAVATPFGSPPRPRTPSPKKRARAGSNTSSVLSTPEVKSLRNRDVIVGTPIVEEEEQRSARGSSVEYEKKQPRGRKQSSVETSPRRLRGRK